MTFGGIIYGYSTSISLGQGESLEMSEVEKEFEKWVKDRGYEYLKKGWPDYVLYNKEEVVFVEVKNPHEAPKPHQMKMHILLKNRLGIKVEIATPMKNGFRLEESGFIGFDQEDLKTIEALLNYKTLQDKLESLRGILESWADKHGLYGKKVRIAPGRVWMAFALDRDKKAYNQPNFYISFSHRLTGKLHIEVGLHFRNIRTVGDFSNRVIERIIGHKKEFMSLIAANKELTELGLYLARGKDYIKVKSIRLSELDEGKLSGLRDIFRRHRDVRVIFMSMYEPEEIIAAGDRFSEDVARTFENLYRIFDFLEVNP